MKSDAARPYAMKARAEATAETRARILASANALLATHFFDDMTLEAVAAGADTTVRTVLRHFESKELLLYAAMSARGDAPFGAATPGDRDSTLRALFAQYESIGDAVIRLLAEELRLPAMKARNDEGRIGLRRWVGESFAPELERLMGAEREQLLNALIVALDVYTWKLLRRDFGLSEAMARAVVRRTIDGLIGGA